MRRFTPFTYVFFAIFPLACGTDGPADSGAGGGGTSASGGSTGGESSGIGGTAGGPLGEVESDVCSFDEVPAELVVDSDGMRVVPFSHPYLRYMGRIDCDAEGGPRFGFPGVNIRVAFSGTALKATFHDFGLGSVTTTNFVEVFVDGARTSTLELTPGEHEVTLAEGLVPGKHEVLVWKRTEATVGDLQLKGMRFEGEELLPAEGKKLRLEFVGDSITCGYGNEISTTNPNEYHFTSAGEDNSSAYGALTATLMDAEYMGVSFSGKGMSRNYDDGAGDTIPLLYPKILPLDPSGPVWDTTRFTPDAVVVNVGTNDYSTAGVDQEIYKTKYAEFLATLRDFYPKAFLVAAIGPMLSDYYPVGAKAWTNAQAGIKDAIAMRAEAGDTNIEFIAFAPQSSPYGEDWHPTAETHQKMAEQLRSVLARKLGLP